MQNQQKIIKSTDILKRGPLKWFLTEIFGFFLSVKSTNFLLV